MRWLLSGVLAASIGISSKTFAETWECSISEGWSANLRTVMFFRDGGSFKMKSRLSEQYHIIYESNQEIHLYRSDFGVTMTAITLFKETSEILKFTFYPPSDGRERFGSGGACLIR